MKYIKRLKELLNINKGFNGWYLDFIRMNKYTYSDRYRHETWFFPNMNSAFEFVKPIVNDLKNKNVNFKIFKSVRTKDGGTDGIWLLFNNKKDIPEGFPIKPISIPENFYELKWKDNEMTIIKFEQYFNTKKYKKYLFDKNVEKYNL